MANEIKVLTRLGFEEKEAKVYLSLLLLGSTTAASIAEDSRIDRTTTYDLLNRLIKKGAVSYVMKGRVKFFSPTDPRNLDEDLKKKKEELDEVMPRLLALVSAEKEKTEVVVFKGTEAVKNLMESILRDREDYIMIGAGHELSALNPLWARKWVIEAYRLGIKGRLICEEGFGDDPADVIGKGERYKIVSKDFALTTVLAWANKTALLILESPYYTILIENSRIADRHRLYFNYLWKYAREPTKKEKRRTIIKG